MNIETRIFNNWDVNGKKSEGKFSEKNERMFKEHIPGILESWGNYLKTYAGQSTKIFGKPELPWLKFDEPTWVSSLAVAIAKNYPDALLIEELPVKKKGRKTDSGSEELQVKTRGKKTDLGNADIGKKTDLGNADIWCCLNPSTEENCMFSFYLEAKFGSWSRRNLDKIPPIEKLKDVHDQIADNEKKDNLLSRVFRDYQKSAGKSDGNGYYTTISPHQKEEGRKHNHVFLGMLIKPVTWDVEDWPEQVKFLELFRDKVRVHTTKNKQDNEKPSPRNFYNFPCAGILMKDEKRRGFVSLIMMLGEVKAK